MGTETGAAEAKKAYIAYGQLNDLLAELSRRLKAATPDGSYGFRAASPSYAKSFNVVLRMTKDAFKLDEQFLGSIHEIEELEEAVSPSLPDQVLSRGSILRGALRAFIMMNMAPTEKTRIGFLPDTG